MDRIEIHFSSQAKIYVGPSAKSIAGKKLHQSRGSNFLHSRIVAWHRDNEANAAPFFWACLPAPCIVLRLRIVLRTFECNNNKKRALKRTTLRIKKKCLSAKACWKYLLFYNRCNLFILFESLICTVLLTININSICIVSYRQ